MSAEGYRIRRLDNNTELISTPPNSNVEPFPTKSWNEPLPIAVQGRPLPQPEKEKGEAKSLTRFYPPLLLCSTMLTGVFLFLYLSKPVIVEGPSENSEAEAMLERSSMAAPVAAIEPLMEREELSPFPGVEDLTSNQLPGFEVAPAAVEMDSSLQQTILGVEQIVKVESLNGELEKFTVSLPVLYPEDMLSWSEESVAEAQLLASDIEMHIARVREIQEDSIRLLENWNQIVAKSTPTSVLETGEKLGLKE